MADLGALREALAAEGAAAKDADAAVRSLRAQLAGAQKQLAFKVGFCVLNDGAVGLVAKAMKFLGGKEVMKGSPTA